MRLWQRYEATLTQLAQSLVPAKTRFPTPANDQLLGSFAPPWCQLVMNP